MMKKGIDLQKALEILGERSKVGGEPHTHHHHSRGGGGGGDDGIENPEGCRCLDNAPEEAKHWGQTIALLGDEDQDRLVKELGNKEVSLEEQKEALDRERKQRQVDLLQRMNGMTARELVQFVLATQAQRVATYRSYDRYAHAGIMPLLLMNFPH
jgi:hypothetical protein